MTPRQQPVAVAPTFLRDVTAWDGVWAAAAPAERIVLSALAEALSAREGLPGSPAPQGAAEHEPPSEAADAPSAVTPSDLLTEVPGQVSLEALRATLRRHGLVSVPAQIEDAPAALCARGLIEQAGSGYAFVDSALRDFLTRHKPLTLVKGELDNMVPLAQQLFLCAEGFYKDGKLADAQGLARRAIDLAPGHVRARLLLGAALRAEGKLTAAVQALTEAHGCDEQAARAPLTEVLLLGADDLLKAGDRGGALAMYERVLKLSPRDPLARERCIALWTERREEEHPETDLAAALQVVKASETHRVVTAAESRKQQERESQAQKAQKLEQRGEWAQALAIYQELLEHDSSFAWHEALARVKEEQRLQARFQEGLEAYQRGLWPQALAALGEVLAVRPDYQDQRSAGVGAALGLGLSGDASTLAMKAADALSRARAQGGTRGIRRQRLLAAGGALLVLCGLSAVLGSRWLSRPTPSEQVVQGLSAAEQEVLAGKGAAASERLDELLARNDLSPQLRELAWKRREALRRGLLPVAAPSAASAPVSAAPVTDVARAPRRRAGAGSAAGGPLPMAVVNETMMGVRGALAGCLEAAGPTKLAVKLTVQPDGSVHSVGTDWDGQPGACASKVLQGLRFPQPSNEATVRLSFQYMNLRK